MSDCASTTSFSVANNTRALSTPGSAVTAFSIFLAQLGQSIPVTFQLKRWLPEGSGGQPVAFLVRIVGRGGAAAAIAMIVMVVGVFGLCGGVFGSLLQPC